VGVNYWNIFWLCVPILLVILVGMALLVLVVVVQLSRSSRNIKSFFLYFLEHWRLFAFLTVYLWVYTFVFASQININVTRENQYNKYDTFISCSFQRQTAINAFQNVPGGQTVIDELPACAIDSVVNYPLMVIATINYVAQGVMLFLIFGTTKRVYLVWWNLFRHRKLLSKSDTNPEPLRTASSVANPDQNNNADDLEGTEMTEGTEMAEGNQKTDSSEGTVEEETQSNDDSDSTVELTDKKNPKSDD